MTIKKVGYVLMDSGLVINSLLALIKTQQESTNRQKLGTIHNRKSCRWDNR